MSTLDQLVVFKEAADLGNITLASKRLHISQPSVSVHIRNLEREYKTELFRRTNRGVQLTQPGRILYDKVEIILRELENAREEIRAYRNDQGKLVHIGATLTIGEYLLPCFMGFTLAKQSAFHVNAHIANTDTISKEVQDKKLSIGLIEGPIELSDEIVRTEFWHDELVVVVSGDHPWAHASEVGFDDLARERYVTRERGSGTRAAADQGLERAGFDVGRMNIAMELSSTKAIKDTVAAGTGFTILSELTVQREVGDGLLSALRVAGCSLTRPLSVITHRDVELTMAEQEFMDLLFNSDVLEAVQPLPFLPARTAPPAAPAATGGAPFDDRGPASEGIAQWNGLSDDEREVCQAMWDAGSITSAQAAGLLGGTQRNVLPLLNGLIGKGVVEAFGGSRNRRYRIA